MATVHGVFRQPATMALLLLPTTVPVDLHLFRHLLSTMTHECEDNVAPKVVTTGGGASTLRKKNIIPRAVVGDFDTVDKATLAWMEEHGVKIKKDKDEYTSDLYKGLTFIHDSLPRTEHCVVVGAFGGRFDHEMQAINALYQFKHLFTSLWLTGTGNAATLLRTGEARMNLDERREGPLCGVFPIGCASELATTGLRYDVEHAEAQFGGMISTSNEVQDPRSVSIATSEDVVWWHELRLEQGKRYTVSMVEETCTLNVDYQGQKGCMVGSLLQSNF